MTRKQIFFILVFAFLAFCGAFLFYIYKNPFSHQQIAPSILYTIEKGTGFGQIGRELKEKNLIQCRLCFEIYLLFSGKWKKIQTGTYELPYGISIYRLTQIITSGATKKERITIPEGWTLLDIAVYGEQKGYFTKEQFFEYSGAPLFLVSTSTISAPLQKIIEDYDFLRDVQTASGKKLTNLEGFLFPDTYELDYPVRAEQLITKALNNFQKKFLLITQPSEKKLYQLLIMASLLEREVKTYEDKQLVAGILWKRIEKGWPLQVDATLNYFTGKSSRELTKNDLQTDSPYNTYLYKGLPPTPICNPGLDSIKAALYYQDSPYWYYLSTPNGKTIFSETFEQHKQAKAKYLK